jgi:hypothetical protein
LQTLFKICAFLLTDSGVAGGLTISIELLISGIAVERFVTAEKSMVIPLMSQLLLTSFEQQTGNKNAE